MLRNLPMIALLASAAFAVPAIAAGPEGAALLGQVCAKPLTDGKVCQEAKNYLKGKTCNIELTGTRAQGAFITPGSRIILLGYRSDCEPHVNNFGGALLFEEEDGRFVFRKYERGMVFTDCATVTEAAGRDRLFCLSAYMGQGHLESAVVEVRFGRNVSGDITADTDMFATATDSSGAYGANQVSCDASREIFGFDGLKPGPGAHELTVKVSFADAAGIKQACRPGAVPPGDAIVPAPPGTAYIAAGTESTGPFVLDLQTRELTPAD